MKLRTFLLAVVGLTLVPLLGVAGLAVETSLAGLKGLATSTGLESGDLRNFYEEARLARDAYRRWLTVALVDPSGRQVLNLLRPLGSPLARVGAAAEFPRTL